MHIQGDGHYSNLTVTCEDSQKNEVILSLFYRQGCEDLWCLSDLHKVTWTQSLWAPMTCQSMEGAPDLGWCQDQGRKTLTSCLTSSLSVLEVLWFDTFSSLLVASACWLLPIAFILWTDTFSAWLPFLTHSAGLRILDWYLTIVLWIDHSKRQ